MQFLRFLRRTEGVEAARKYFMEARKSPSCTYHVYVAYAMMAFCLDKDAKVISSIEYWIWILCYFMVLHLLNVNEGVYILRGQMNKLLPLIRNHT